MLVEEEDSAFYKDLGAMEGDRKFLAYLDRLCTEPDNGIQKFIYFSRTCLKYFIADSNRPNKHRKLS